MFGAYKPRHVGPRLMTVHHEGLLHVVCRVLRDLLPGELATRDLSCFTCIFWCWDPINPDKSSKLFLCWLWRRGRSYFFFFVGSVCVEYGIWKTYHCSEWAGGLRQLVSGSQQLNGQVLRGSPTIRMYKMCRRSLSIWLVREPMCDCHDINASVIFVVDSSPFLS